MTYRLKYLSPLKNPNLERGPRDRGQRPNPELWDEHTVIERDRYYAWLKHKAQAKFRGEEYDLTAQQWADLWSHDLWMNRGRAVGCNMLIRIDNLGAWTWNNVKVILVEHKGKYYQRSKD
jgi:hypothetical protein